NYYLLNTKGEIIAENILEQQAKTIFGHKSDGISITMSLPFRPKSLIAVSTEDQIISAMSDHFLIKKYSTEGKYLQAFYYPYQHAPFDKEAYINSFGPRFKTHKKAVQELGLPGFWPVLGRMLIDDQNRLWVAT